MKKKLLALVALVVFCLSLHGQTTGEKKTYKMYVTELIKPMIGHENQFEAAIKAHNAKFHPAGTYNAWLTAVVAGSGSDGWYVWVMGPLMFKDLDNQPQGKKDHDDDWSKNIDPHVAQYGDVNFWRMNEDLSVTPANYNPDYIDVWLIDLKPGKRYQFSELMKKWKPLWEAKKYPYSFRVFFNELNSAKGANAAFVFSFKNFTEFDMDINFRGDFEAMYGPGSYDNFWREWNECVASTDEHLRKTIK